MANGGKAGEKYSVSGTVVNLTAPYNLAGHGLTIEFGFFSPANPPSQPDPHNCVFYLMLNSADVLCMAERIVRSFVSKRPVRVHFASPPYWNGKSDPSYVITNITEE